MLSLSEEAEGVADRSILPEEPALLASKLAEGAEGAGALRELRLRLRLCSSLAPCRSAPPPERGGKRAGGARGTAGGELLLHCTCTPEDKVIIPDRAALLATEPAEGAEGAGALRELRLRL